MNKDNHNRQAAWLARGWGVPTANPRNTPLLSMDFDALTKEIVGRREDKWPEWSEAKKHLKHKKAENVGKDFANPFIADKIYITEIEKEIKSLFDKFDPHLNSGPLTQTERLAIDKMVAMHISRQPATISAAQQHLIDKLVEATQKGENATGIELATISGRTDLLNDFCACLEQFLKTIDDHTLSIEKRLGLVNGTSDMAKLKEDGLGPKTIGYLMYSSYAQTLTRLQKLNVSKFSVGGKALTSLPHSFIRAQDIVKACEQHNITPAKLGITSFTLDELSSVNDYFFGPISSSLGVFYTPRQMVSHSLAFDQATFFMKAFDLTFLSQPSGVLIFKDEAHAMKFYEIVKSSTLTPASAYSHQQKKPKPFEVNFVSAPPTPAQQHKLTP